MKKHLLFTIVSWFIVWSGFSQIELKPAIGFNVAAFDSDPVFEAQDDSLVTAGKAGYQLGASLVIGRKLYVEPGVFYTRYNQEMNPTNIEKQEFSYGPSQLRIPVNFGFQFIGSTNSFAGLKIFLGPSLMIPLNLKENDYPLVKADIKSPQFDIAVGAGLNVWFLFLDVSYGWGLSQQFADDPIEAKMQAFYANLGFRFKIKSDEE